MSCVCTYECLHVCICVPVCACLHEEVCGLCACVRESTHAYYFNRVYRLNLTRKTSGAHSNSTNAVPGGGSGGGANGGSAREERCVVQ